jgi:hypothetical protein
MIELLKFVLPLYEGTYIIWKLCGEGLIFTSTLLNRG